MYTEYYMFVSTLVMLVFRHAWCPLFGPRLKAKLQCGYWKTLKSVFITPYAVVFASYRMAFNQFMLAILK